MVSNRCVGRSLAIRGAILLFASFSVAQTLPRAPEPRPPCDFKSELVEEKHKPRWFTSDEMKQRATVKVDVAGILKNADVNATVIASVIVGRDGRVECLEIVNPKHPLVVVEVARALRQWRFKPMEQNEKPASYVGWLQFRFCRIGCSEGTCSVTLLQ
jgi:Gram-negative bacterial TonB protein C-terminal